MSKGISAFIVMLTITMSISILGGLGYYSNMHVNYQAGYNSDVQTAANAFMSQSATNTGGNLFNDFTVGASNTLNIAWQILSNTSGVLQLLFGIPKKAAGMFQYFFQIVFGVTFLAFVRGVVLQ